MANKNIGAQVKGGLKLTGKVLLTVGWFGLVLGGLGEGGFASGGADRPLLGSAILVVAAVIFFWTMNRWIKVFPGLVALATLNAFVTVFTGHATGNPSTRLVPGDAAIYFVLLAICTIVSLRFTKRKLRLRVFDRIAVFGFVFCIFWTAVDKHVQIMAPAAACGFLSLAWIYDRIRHHRHPHPPAPGGLDGRPGRAFVRLRVNSHEPE
jgi:hypothetical protein